MNILETIAEATRKRVEKEKTALPERVLRQKLGNRQPPMPHRFRDALKREGMSYICEVKKASPSRGLIAPEFPYLSIAKEYETAGAAAISCLTEPAYFQGDRRYLREIADIVQIPVLKKDFIIDPYMIWQAAADGAAAILLICAILSDQELEDYRCLAETLSMDALVEVHDETEAARAKASGAEIIGVNNRDLKTFSVDTEASVRLRKLIPPQIVFVSESGIRTHADIEKLHQNGADAVLIGETLMRSEDKRAMLMTLNGGQLI